MELIKPSAEILSITPDALKLIERAGRTCYKSEERITADSAEKFFKSLVKNGHLSVIEHAVMTVKFICDRGVTHELVRHRLASFSQESTRYCNYRTIGIRFIVPCDFELDEIDRQFLKSVEIYYNYCINDKHRTPQQARYFLPNGLKTEIVVTANIREWRHIFNLRKSAKAHPQMNELMCLLYEEIKRTNMQTLFED